MSPSSAAFRHSIDRVENPHAVFHSENTAQQRRGEQPYFAQPDWLSEAVHATVHRTRGIAKCIADALTKTETYVRDLADRSRRVVLKAHEIVPIVLETGDYAILDAIEQRVGRVAFQLPAVNPHVEQMNAELARNVRQFGDFLHENGDALADGTLEPHEVKPLLHTIDAMLAGLSEYRLMVLNKAVRDATR